MFDVVGAPVASCSPVLATDFGRLITYFQDRHESTMGVEPDETLRVPGGALLHRFVRRPWDAELLVGPVSSKLPAHMSVLGCVAALWRVRARDTAPDCRFVCHWPSSPAGSKGSPTTGAGLDAIAWDVGRYRLSLGTEDGEFLATRAENRDFVPSRFAKELSLSTVDYMEDGLVVPLSSLEPTEIIQVQFIVAWALDDWDCPASWFAVEQSPAHLLRELTMTKRADP